MAVRWRHCVVAALMLTLTLAGIQVRSQAQSGSAPFRSTPGSDASMHIVGGLSSLNQYTRHEEPFWAHQLAALSHGKFSADIVPFDRAGVPGPDMLRLMQLGVLPFGTALLSQISGQHPELAAPDLAGLNPDLPSLRKNLAAFRPYLEKTLRAQHGIELLAVYTYPAQLIFCKKEFKTLNDLAGRRIRIASATQSDFVQAFGAEPVLLRLNELVPNLQSNNVDCAITGAMSGNTIGLHHQTNYLYSMPITWGLSIFAANQSAWEALPAELRTLLRRELPRLETAIWQESDRETTEGVACDVGLSGCPINSTGTMKLVTASPADERQRRALLTSTVIPRWVQRCGAHCGALWNQTLGTSSGVHAVDVP